MTLFCKTCYDANKGKDTYLPHATSNQNCLSRNQFSSLEAYPLEVTESGDHIIPGYETEDQGHSTQFPQYTNNIAGLNHIDPVPVQILSLTDANNQPIHLELDNGATCSYISLQEAIKRGFNISPNSQTSQLGDGVTIIKSCGEVYASLYRNAHKLRFRAIVAQHLHYPVIGGTIFVRDNNIKQDFVQN